MKDKGLKKEWERFYAKETAILKMLEELADLKTKLIMRNSRLWDKTIGYIGIPRIDAEKLKICINKSSYKITCQNDGEATMVEKEKTDEKQPAFTKDKEDRCKFDVTGKCYAAACLTNHKCTARQDDGTPKYRGFVNEEARKEAHKELGLENDYSMPSNLDECFVALNKVLDEKDIKSIKRMKEKDLCSLHLSLGMDVRNMLGLWEKSNMAEYFNSLGINHPDDMWGIIITSFHRQLNGKFWELDNQVQHYKDFWEKQKKEETK